jgi:prephenate dehydrogenase
MVIEHATLDLVAILGYGRFGRALGGLLSEAGIAHRAHDPHLLPTGDAPHAIPAEYRAESLASLVRGVGFVVVAVPVAQMRRALAELRPHVEAARPHPIVLDVGSVKVGPSAALADVMGHSIPWCATHPLFGPSSLALAERPLRVVVCPAPDEYGHATATARVRDLYQRIGCEVIEQTPESHDRVMAHTHALTFFIAKGMIDAGAGMDVPFAPPSFQAMARAIETVRSDAGHLFAAIARDNPFAAEARKQLVQALSTIDRALDDAVANHRLGHAPAEPETCRPALSHEASTESRAPDSASPAGHTGSDSPDTARFAIPDLGQRSPELKEARDHIDEVDREIVRLLAQRAQLSQRAAQAKAKLGAPVLDGAREAEVIGARRAWASELKLDAEAATDVFRAIMTMSRRAQRT